MTPLHCICLFFHEKWQTLIHLKRPTCFSLVCRVIKTCTKVKSNKIVVYKRCPATNSLRISIAFSDMFRRKLLKWSLTRKFRELDFTSYPLFFGNSINTFIVFFLVYTITVSNLRSSFQPYQRLVDPIRVFILIAWSDMFRRKPSKCCATRKLRQADLQLFS